jgi:hypothetical protein
MKISKPRGNPKSILICGYAMSGYGIINIVVQMISIYVFFRPHNLAITLGYGSLGITGLFAVMIAHCLIDINNRLAAVKDGVS